jgi:hypothetical protein
MFPISRLRLSFFSSERTFKLASLFATTCSPDPIKVRYLPSSTPPLFRGSSAPHDHRGTKCSCHISTARGLFARTPHSRSPQPRVLPNGGMLNSPKGRRFLITALPEHETNHLGVALLVEGSMSNHTRPMLTQSFGHVFRRGNVAPTGWPNNLCDVRPQSSSSRGVELGARPGTSK